MSDLGFLLLTKSGLVEAEGLLKEALAIHSRLMSEHHPAIVHDLVALAMLSQQKGDFQDSHDYLKQARNHVPADPRLAPSLNALIDGQTALTYLKQDNPVAAEPYLRRDLAANQLRLSPSGLLAGNDRFRAEMSRTLGLLLAALGRDAEAIPLLRESLGEFSRLGLGHRDAVEGAIALGTILSREGDLDGAAKVLRESLIAVRPGTPEEAFLSSDLASVALKRGDLDEARKLALRSAEILEKSSQSSAYLADSYFFLGVVSQASGDAARAGQYWDQAVEIARKKLDPNHPVIAAVELFKAINLIGGSTEQITEGIRLANHSRALIEARLGHDRAETSQAIRILALLKWSRGDLEGARSTLEQLVAADEVAMPRRLVLGGERGYASVLAQSSPTDAFVSFHFRGLPNDPAAARLALRAVLQRKGTLQDLLAEQARLQHKSSEAEILYGRWVRLENASRSCSEPDGSLHLIDAGSVTRAGICAKDVLAREADVNQALRDFVAKAPSFGAAAKPVEISQLAQALRDLGGYVLAEIVQYTPTSPKDETDPARYAAYILFPDEQIEWADLGSQKEIDALTARLRELQSNPNSPEADAMRVARELDQMVMQPIRAKLGGRTRLFVAPDGDLNMIDFSSLVDERNQYLIDKYQIAGLTSGRDLLRFAGAESHHASVAAANVVFEDPSFQAAVKPPRNPGAPALPGTLGAALGCEAAFLKQEWTGVSLPPELLKRWIAALPGATFFKEADANKWNLASLHSPRTLWLLTHGFFCTDAEVAGVTKTAPRPNFWRSPMDRGALVLAGGSAPDPAVRRNGYITATEIADLNLQDTELVVLGACETALGVAHVGDGVHGLRRALILAGARSQVMTLWKVRGSETFALLSDFASRLQSGADRLTALRAAQLKIRETKGTRHPYFWAGIYFMGFPGPMNALPIRPNVR
jgi:CHAT domain-containing protein